MKVIEGSQSVFETVKAEVCREVIEAVRQAEGGCTDEEALSVLGMAFDYLAERIKQKQLAAQAAQLLINNKESHT